MNARRSGYSVLEALVAMGLLAVAALALLTVFIGGLKMMQRSNEMAAANDVARTVLEAIKRDYALHSDLLFPSGEYKFDGRLPDPPLDDDLIDPPPPFPPQPYPSSKINGIDYAVVVSGKPEAPRLSRVRVEVYWGNESQPIILETLIHP